MFHLRLNNEIKKKIKISYLPFSWILEDDAESIEINVPEDIEQIFVYLDNELLYENHDYKREKGKFDFFFTLEKGDYLRFEFV